MTGELIVALFAILFLAFCLTAVALYALSRDNDDIANRSVQGLRDLHLDESPSNDETGGE